MKNLVMEVEDIQKTTHPIERLRGNSYWWIVKKKTWRTIHDIEVAMVTRARACTNPQFYVLHTHIHIRPLFYLSHAYIFVMLFRCLCFSQFLFFFHNLFYGVGWFTVLAFGFIVQFDCCVCGLRPHHARECSTSKYTVCCV